MIIKRWILFCVIFFFSGCSTFNPATNRNEVILIPTSQEVSMGQQAHKELSLKNKIITGTEEAKRLDRIGQTVVRHSDRQDYVYHFNLVESNDFNAFTIPGGYIYFYTGLFRALTSDDQIAAVLAHEIGHCSAKHTVKRFQATLGYSWIGQILGEVLSTKAPGIAPVINMGANSIAQLAMSAYSRHDEYEADRLGIKYLYLAGFQLDAMIKAFDILQENSKGDYVPLILRTHPYIKDRIEAIKKEIEEIKQKHSLL